MGLIITPQSKVDEYFASDSLGQSTAKLLLQGFNHFLSNHEKGEKDLYYSEKAHFIRGSAVDLILTGEEELFDEFYHVTELVKKPSDVEMSIVRRYFDDMIVSFGDSTPKDMTEGYNEEILLGAINAEGWQSRWKDETRINKIVENCNDYYKELFAGLGKQILSSDEHGTISLTVNSFRTHPRTSKYFDREGIQKYSNVDVYYQYPIYFEYRGVKMKSLLDILIVVKDETGQIIALEPIDVKTMAGYTTNFLFSLKQRRYDIQAAWYTLALEQHFNANKNDIIIRNFKFLVESTTNQGEPLVFTASDDLLHIGRYGRKEIKLVDTNLFSETAGKDILISREIIGFEKLLDDYLFYVETEWATERRIAESGGEFTLNWDSIYYEEN